MKRALWLFAICGFVVLSAIFGATQMAQVPNRVRMAEDVLATHLVHRVEPTTPAIAPPAEGTVVLAIVVGKDGKVIQVKLLKGDPVLAQSAIDAVRQWSYEPYLLNGTPVEVESQVTVRFRGPHITQTNPPNGVAARVVQMQVSSEPPPTLERDPNPPTRVRVSETVSQSLLIHKVQPTYPLDVMNAHISGAVVLRAVIGKDGDITALHVVSGPKELYQSALDAVRQWRYKRYFLNGQPAEVETQITVNYTLN